VQSHPPKPVQQQPLIFLEALAFWTGRTGFEGEESPSKFYDRAVLGVNTPSKPQA
jgi:hypothetical protein